MRTERISGISARVKEERGPEIGDPRNVVGHVQRLEIGREQYVLPDSGVEFDQEGLQVRFAKIISRLRQSLARRRLSPCAGKAIERGHDRQLRHARKMIRFHSAAYPSRQLWLSPSGALSWAMSFSPSVT